MQSVPVDCLSCAHAIWSRLCGAVLFNVLLLSRYLYLNHVAHLTFTELIISYIFLSFFHFEFSPSSGVSCHAAAGGERCLRRRAPRAPRTRARQRTAEKVCRKVCVQCECRAVPGPRDASRVVVARRDGSGLASVRASAPRRPHATADGTRRRTNLRHRSQASLRIGCAGRCVRAEGGPGPCGRAARRRLTRPGRAGGTWSTCRRCRGRGGRWRTGVTTRWTP